MLMLVFYVGDDRYAFECDSMIEVVPKVDLKDVPHTPDYVAGMLNYRGTPIPVVDLCQLILDRSTCSKFHSRIIVLHIKDKNGHDFHLGLLAEKVTETGYYAIEDFVESGSSVKETPYLGGFLTDNIGMIQLFKLDAFCQTLEESVFDLSNKREGSESL